MLRRKGNNLHRHFGLTNKNKGCEGWVRGRDVGGGGWGVGEVARKQKNWGTNKKRKRSLSI